MEIQKQLGEINATLVTLTKTVDSTKAKVELLNEWRHKIAGGIVVLGVVCTLIGVGITKFSSYFEFKSPETKTSAVAPGLPVEQANSGTGRPGPK
ncbi:hypothetical protein [Massilia soli]|uniref:Uncharacterized protein n=1 Tax=Massilia soli TaxID=2792854 RepID=A0ABS7SR88_9BURK|nr:hypothetical protein [Massilia soli]MBZ2208455.1 hypothetical protein [Massilia soli]